MKSDQCVKVEVQSELLVMVMMAVGLCGVHWSWVLRQGGQQTAFWYLWIESESV